MMFVTDQDVFFSASASSISKQKDFSVFFMKFIFFIFYIKSSRCMSRNIPGVNFLNILCTNFLYEHCFDSFFYVHVTREKLLKRCLYEKFERKMLMKLTPSSPTERAHVRHPCWKKREELVDFGFSMKVVNQYFMFNILKIKYKHLKLA